MRSTIRKPVDESYFLPPPSYEDVVAPGAPASPVVGVRSQTISRKPVPSRPSAPINSTSQYAECVRPGGDPQEDDLTKQLDGVDLETDQIRNQARPPISLRTSFPTTITDSVVYDSPNRTDSASTEIWSSPTTTSTTSSRPSLVSTSLALSTTSSYLQKGYREARHFAGGLLNHPSESTKHYSILRHSHGLVFYQGTSTSVTISIFSDASLPADHTFWLQSKGWSGKTGMRARALVGRNGKWLNVTPYTRATSDQMNPNDERAWQRDILKFQKRASGNVQERHRLRETAILRIPVEAEDGYFRVVLCQGDQKKVLCPSPVFRVLSTSTSPSSIRGASLSTLPLELGAKILSSAAMNAAGNAISPITQSVQNAIQPYTPPSWAQTSANLVYDESGAEERVDATLADANNRYDSMRDTLFTPLGGEVPTSDDGPKSPFPIKFVGRVEPGTGNNKRQLGVPTANLTAIPENVVNRLHGYYFGWARFKVSQRRDQAVDEVRNEWYQAIVSALPVNSAELARVKVDGVQKRISAYMINDFEDETFFGAQLEVRVMGFIRPHDRASSGAGMSGRDILEEDESAMLAALNDVAIAQVSLDRPAWGPEPVLERSESGGLDKVKTHYAHTRLTATRQVSRIPFHKAGLRTTFDDLRDKALGNGGIYIVR